MNHSLNPKIHALRVKTDVELASLIGKRLDAGLAAARTLQYEEAEKAYEEARVWLRFVARLERNRLEQKLEQLREMLDEPAGDSVRVRTACG